MFRRAHRQAVYMHADRFDFIEKSLAIGAGSIHAPKPRSLEYRPAGKHATSCLRAYGQYRSGWNLEYIALPEALN